MGDDATVSVSDTRSHLNNVAESLGIADPDGFPNKAALVEAIEAVGLDEDKFPDLPSTADVPDVDAPAPSGEGLPLQGPGRRWYPPGKGRGGYPVQPHG